MLNNIDTMLKAVSRLTHTHAQTIITLLTPPLSPPLSPV